MACCNCGSLQTGYFCTLGLTPSHHRRQGATLPWEIIILRKCHHFAWRDESSQINFCKWLSQYQPPQSQVSVVTLITLLSSAQIKCRTSNESQCSFIKIWMFHFSILCHNCSNKALKCPVEPINYLSLQFTLSYWFTFFALSAPFFNSLLCLRCTLLFSCLLYCFQLQPYSTGIINSEEILSTHQIHQ